MTRTHRPAPHRAPRGFSLIELMVAVTIGLIVTLAVTGVLVSSEGRKRTANSVNDLSQNANYVAYTLDKMLRAAGSGFSERSADTYGCLISAARSQRVLPPPAALPAPFANFVSGTRQVRVAPVVIGAGLASGGRAGPSDVLMIMSGNSLGAGAAMDLLPGSVTGNQNRLTVSTGVGLRDNDIVLLAPPGGGGTGCLVSRIGGLDNNTPPGPQSLRMAGPGEIASTGVRLVDFNANGVLVPLGNSSGSVNEQPPEFNLVGVGDGDQLFIYDLLRLNSDTFESELMADGVAAMFARYGVDTTGDNVLDLWVDPADKGGLSYSADSLLNGSGQAQAALQTIVAVRVGLVLRASLPEQAPVSGNELVLFNDIAALPGTVSTVSFTPAEADRNLRHRTVEFTVPLRNAIFH